MMPMKEVIPETPKDGGLERSSVMEWDAVVVPAVTPHRVASAAQGKRWGVILAGGDGTRLQRLTQLICGYNRPKQFCPLVGSDTLLEQTRKRAERSIAWEQILVPLNRRHRAFYLQEQGIRPSQRIVQPANRGT